MADETAQQRTLETFLRRQVRDGTRDLTSLKALSLEAFAKVNDGTTVIEVGIEGGTTRAVVNCAPHVVLAAAEAVIAELDEDNPLRGTSREHIYADLSGGRIET